MVLMQQGYLKNFGNGLFEHSRHTEPEKYCRGPFFILQNLSLFWKTFSTSREIRVLRPKIESIRKDETVFRTRQVTVIAGHFYIFVKASTKNSCFHRKFCFLRCIKTECKEEIPTFMLISNSLSLFHISK